MKNYKSFINNSEALNINEVHYWKRFFRNNLKIGVELESQIDEEYDEEEVAEHLSDDLSATGDVTKFGEYGVVNVHNDGSLNNGVEIVTVGRRLDFVDLYYQYKVITDKLNEYEPICDQRAGLHNHILIDYAKQNSGDLQSRFSRMTGCTYNSLEKPIPGVILKNFMQLLRSHAPELVWLTSTVHCSSYEGAITRMTNFCEYDTLLSNSPLTTNLKDYINRVSPQSGSDNRYKFCNLRYMKTKDDNNNELERFHMELRFPDGSIYPAQIAMQNILYASLILKAIELSVGGIITTGNASQWSRTKELLQTIRTSGYGSRLSEPLDTSLYQEFRDRANDMLVMLKPILDTFDVHLYGMLRFLAQEPISLMRTHMSDEEINSSFNTMIENIYEMDMTDCNQVIEYIALQKLDSCYNEDSYKQTLCEKLSKTREEIEKMFTKLMIIEPSLRFDKSIGSYVIN